jgi:hypothetical protein
MSIECWYTRACQPGTRFATKTRSFSSKQEHGNDGVEQRSKPIEVAVEQFVAGRVFFVPEYQASLRVVTGSGGADARYRELSITSGDDVEGQWSNYYCDDGTEGVCLKEWS